MNIDWTAIYQDHPADIIGPSDELTLLYSRSKHKFLRNKEFFSHEGSFCTSVLIVVSGGRVRMSGNPSRVGRPDNLFGYTDFDDCIAVYNEILAEYNLPPFTKGVQVLTGSHTEKPSLQTTGAVLTEIHFNTNFSVGHKNEDDYLKGISCLNYKNSRPHLFPNGKTVDWKSIEGNASQLIYANVYNKAHDLKKTLNKLKRSYGVESPEYIYIKDLIEYCKKEGVVRWEQKFKGKFLRDNNLNHYGHIDWNVFRKEHEEFLAIQNRLKVEAMTLEHVAEKLISEGVVDTTKAANTTAFYAFNWMHGRVYDCVKRQEQMHRSRLRKIGIDIAVKCDLTKFSPVFIKEIRQVNVAPLRVPDWYQKPQRTALRAVA